MSYRSFKLDYRMAWRVTSRTIQLQRMETRQVVLFQIPHSPCVRISTFKVPATNCRIPIHMNRMMSVVAVGTDWRGTSTCRQTRVRIGIPRYSSNILGNQAADNMYWQPCSRLWARGTPRQLEESSNQSFTVFSMPITLPKHLQTQLALWKYWIRATATL